MFADRGVLMRARVPAPHYLQRLLPPIVNVDALRAWLFVIVFDVRAYRGQLARACIPLFVMFVDGCACHHDVTCVSIANTRSTQWLTWTLSAHHYLWHFLVFAYRGLLVYARGQYLPRLLNPIVNVDALRAPLFVVVCDMRIWTHHADHAPPPQDTRRAVPPKHMISALRPKAS